MIIRSVGSLCTGYAGLDMAVSRVFGVELCWYAENARAPRRVLEHHYPDVPNLGDLTKVDWSTVSRPDILTAGYPCQPFSHAGRRRGTRDRRHLWPFVAGAVRDLRPCVVILENVAAHVERGLSEVLGTLAALGYCAAWGVFRADDVGAPHRRARLFVVAADTTRIRRQWRVSARDGLNGLADCDHAAVPDTVDWQRYASAIRRWAERIGRAAPSPVAVGPCGGPTLSPAFTEWMMALPRGWVSEVPGVSSGDAIRLCGNGVVPLQAELAVRHLWPLLFEGG